MLSTASGCYLLIYRLISSGRSREQREGCLFEVARQSFDGLKRQVALASLELAEVFGADAELLSHPFLGEASSTPDPSDIATKYPLQVAFHDFSLIVCYSLVYTLISCDL